MNTLDYSRDPKKQGTTVKNPTTRAGLHSYVTCGQCGRQFTRLGFFRHRCARG